MKTSRGFIVVFEGMDRCGKSTQSKKLVEYLNKKEADGQGQGAKFFQFPNRSTPVGSLIDRYLKKEIELDDHAVHLLFTANRWELMKSIEQTVQSGVHVIIDRYSFSGAAYSAAKPALPLDWCFSMESGLIAPDRVFFLAMPAEKLQQRGDFGSERYETTDFQRRVEKNYKSLWNDETWREINALGSLEEVHKRILNCFDDITAEDETKRL